MLDRTQAPAIHQISNINLPEVESHTLSGGRRLYIHREHGTNAFKIELVNQGGYIHAGNGAEVQLSMKMLNEGTVKRTGHQVSEYIDSLGSFLEISPGFDHSTFAIYGLKKFFKENVAIMAEMLYEPAFTQASLDTVKEKEKNKLSMNLEKGSYISSVNLRKALFGAHPYGYSLLQNDIEQCSIEQIKAIHAYAKNFDIYLSGDIPANAVAVIEELFASPSDKASETIHLPINSGNHIEHRNSKFIQSSIKYGRTLFNRTHPDYFKFIVTNEVLAGFFGSRLMKNIREDKGFTYGIYSSIYPLNQTGYFLISTDVKGENEEETINEIKKELDLLANKPVPAGELDTVKSYMIGTFVNSFSSPFAAITKFKTLNTQSLSLDFYLNYIDQVRSVSQQDILETTNQYLRFEDLTASIAGA